MKQLNTRLNKVSYKNYARFFTVASIILILSSCTLNNVNNSSQEISAPAQVALENNNQGKTIWKGSFTGENWRQAWDIKKSGSWGLDNTSVLKDPSGKFKNILRVNYPAGSASPAVSRKQKAPLGGAQFFANLSMAPKKSLRLSYYLRFSDNFDFVKGGKLPGLYGGKNNRGGETPDGTDGFSTRFMWRKNGDGEVYAYLPSSTEYGTSIGRGSWRFVPGKWHYLEQVLVLNEPNKSNGSVEVMLDGKQVLKQDKLTFRTVDNLKIEGIFFSTFFGGGDASWSTPKNVYTDFADFAISEVPNQ